MHDDLMMKLAEKLGVTFETKRLQLSPLIYKRTRTNKGQLYLVLASGQEIKWSLDPDNPDLPALANWIMNELSKTAHLVTLIWYGDNQQKWAYIFHVEDGVFEGKGPTMTDAIVEAVKAWETP